VHDVFVGLPEALGATRKRQFRRVAEAGNRSSRPHETPQRQAAPRSGAGQRAERAEPPRPPSVTAPGGCGHAPGSSPPVLVLKEIEGYAHAEIAELLGITEGASRVRLTRALKRLRDELEDRP